MVLRFCAKNTNSVKFHFFFLIAFHPSDETTQIPLDRNEKHISIKTGSKEKFYTKDPKTMMKKMEKWMERTIGNCPNLTNKKLFQYKDKTEQIQTNGIHQKYIKYNENKLHSNKNSNYTRNFILFN